MTKTENQVKVSREFMINIKYNENLNQPDSFWCDRIELVNNHLMFYEKNQFVFKALVKKASYSKLLEALKDAGLEIGASLCIGQ